VSRPFVVLAALLACAVGCRAPQPVDVPASPEPVIDVLAEARVALKQAGIDKLRWGLTPFFAADRLEERYAPIIEHISGRLGVPIELLVGTSYKDLEDSVVDGRVDVGVLGPYAYVRARKRAPGLSVFASHVAYGSLTYGAYIITREGSDVDSLDGIRGRSFGYVDRRSTSGWLFPAARMLQAHIDPQSDVVPRFLGSHDAVVDAVLAGDVAAGATYDGGLAEARARDTMASGLRVVAKCERIPYDAYVTREGIPVEVSLALGELLSEISTRTEEGRVILANISRVNGFVPVEDSHYDTVRKVEAEVVAALGKAD